MSSWYANLMWSIWPCAHKQNISKSESSKSNNHNEHPGKSIHTYSRSYLYMTRHKGKWNKNDATSNYWALQKDHVAWSPSLSRTGDLETQNVHISLFWSIYELLEYLGQFHRFSPPLPLFTSWNRSKATRRCLRPPASMILASQATTTTTTTTRK